MSTTPELDRQHLELRELKFKVKELKLKVKELQLPSYKKLSFWTSLITVIIAVVGILGQSYYSSIKNERAELRTEQAKKEMDEALLKKASAQKESATVAFNLAALQKQVAAKKAELHEVLVAYSKVTRQLAYQNVGSPDILKEQEKMKSIVTETGKNVSDILLSSGNELLLRNSILKVYYIPSMEAKARRIDSLLKFHGVKSNYELPGYDISKVENNEIVYYNEPQLNYCKAVQALLLKSGLGNFSIRLSSGANATTDHFKIYVVR